MRNTLKEAMVTKIEAMSEEELVRQFSPVLYFHESEKWLPADYNDMIERAALRYNKSHKEVKVESESNGKRPFSRLSLEDKAEFLKTDEDSDKCYLDLLEIDLDELRTYRSGKPRYGAFEIIDTATRRYGNNPFMFDKEYSGKCYAKVRKYSTRRMDKTQQEDWYGSGRWVIIQYYFFYLFNASTNIHEGDWDSSITVAVNLDTRKVLVLYYQHHTRWITRMNTGSSLNLKEWMEHWGDYEDRVGFLAKRKPPAFSLAIKGTHPMGFVAIGAHGIYPTPGTSMFGASIPFRDDLPFTVDDRTAGICLASHDLIEDDSVWPGALNTPKRCRLDELQLITDERDTANSALWFKGRWGERVKNKEGWSGPRGPVWSSAWEDFLKPTNFDDILYEDYYDWKDRYFKGGILGSKILQSEHAL